MTFGNTKKVDTSISMNMSTKPSRAAVTGNDLVRSCLGLATGILTFIGVGQAQAQAQVGLSPMVVQEEVSRGRAQSVLTVNNPSAESLRVRVYAEPFTYDRETGFSLAVEEDNNNLTPYLQFSPREFVVPAGESQRVRVVGLLPPSLLEESEYRAVIFTEALPEGDAVQNRATIQTRVGATVYFRQPEATPILTASSAIWKANSQEVQLLVSNSGDVTARPSAEWQLTRNGEILASGDSGATTVLEGKDRLFKLSNESGGLSLLPGEYEISGELSWRFGANAYSQPFSLPLTVQ